MARGSWRDGLARRAVLGTVATVFAGAGLWAAVGPDDASEAVDLRPPAPVEQEQSVAARGPKPGISFAALSPADPTRLEVPSVGIDAPVDPVPVVDAVLEPPDDVDRIGWWDESARPGADAGQTVMTGHSVHTGAGAMTSLVGVEPGATADVVTPEGRMRYRITRVETVGRDELSDEAQSMFGQDRESGRLVLVTCANWNGSLWEDNLVVYAVPLGSPSRAR